MTKKNVLMVLGLLGVSLMARGQGSNLVTIKGELTGDLKGYDHMYMYNRMGSDTTKMNEGHYAFRFEFKEPEMKMFLPEYITAMKQMYQPFGILISGPGTYYVKSNIEKGLAASSVVSGVKDAVIYRQFEKDQSAAYLKTNRTLASLYGDRWYMIDEKNDQYAAYMKTKDSLEAINTVPVLERLVKKYPDAVATAFVLSGAGKGLSSLGEQEKLYSMLSDRMKKSKEGVLFNDFIQGRKNAAIGNNMIDFQLPDPKGKMIGSGQFKGKYLLIDFWASWCVPCRKSFPHMRELYKKYKNKNLEILSISIDKNKEAWLKAVDQENNPWPQVLDTRSVSQKGFAVSAVPNTFLISPEGKIIAKQVGFDPEGKDNPIEDKIAALLGGIAPDKEMRPGSKGKKVIKAIPMSGMQ